MVAVRGNYGAARAAPAVAQLGQRQPQVAAHRHGQRAQRQWLPQRKALQVRAAALLRSAVPPRERLLFVGLAPSSSRHGGAQRGARALCRELAEAPLLTKLRLRQCDL